MDSADFLIGILPALAVVVVCVIAFLRRRRLSSPQIINPYTMAIETNADAQGRPPLVPPMPPTTTSEKVDPRP